jgi:hypothetical protein
VGAGAYNTSVVEMPIGRVCRANDCTPACLNNGLLHRRT